jgi:hypothetical protein
MKNICLNLKRICILACLAASSLTLHAMPGLDIQGNIRKAVISDDGLLYILARQEASIRVYSADGSFQRNLLIDPTHSLKLQGEPLDFIVDGNGDIYCLTFCPERPSDQSCIVRIDKTGGASTLIPLGKPLNAYQMKRDLSGNFYVLGFEPDVNKSIALKQDHPFIVHIVHKFSPNGKYLGSLLPIAGTNVDDKLFNAMRQPNSFVVLPNGEVWFLELRVDPQTPPWENFRAVHYVDEKGVAALVDIVSPSDHFMMGIHEYAGDVAFNWANRVSALLRLLTRIDGSLIGTIEGVNIRAISKGRAVSSHIAARG